MKTHVKELVRDLWVNEVVPAQTTGESSFTQSSIEGRNDYHAGECYKQAVARLLNVNKWKQYAGEGFSYFQLFDLNGHMMNRPVQQDDYLRIVVPGPDNPDGGGADWVSVKALGERTAKDKAMTYFTVVAAQDPLHKENASTHFFDSNATSTFMIYRNGLTITAAVFGRNEHPNLESDSLFVRVRNWFMYIGAQLGLANAQWKALTEGILKND